MIPALVLCAGLATRLRPLSLVRAKAAVPVAGRPLVAHILESLRRDGVTDAVLNLHHLPDSITSRVGDGTGLGVRVRYSWERTVLGSAGGPRRAAPLMGAETFLVVNGDTLATVDVPALLAQHRTTGALVTMAVTPNHEPLRYGGVAAETDGAVTGFVRRGQTTPSHHFVGVQVVEAAAFVSVPPDVPWESVGALYPALIATRPGAIRTFPAGDGFDDVGTPADYLATALRLSGAATPLVAPSDAVVVESVLWDDVVLGPGAALTRCVVTDGVKIPAGTSWTDRTIPLASNGPLQPGEVLVGTLAVGPLRAG